MKLIQINVGLNAVVTQRQVVIVIMNVITASVIANVAVIMIVVAMIRDTHVGKISPGGIK